MTRISTDTLFHFTRRPDNLLGILTDEFIPHYSLEDFRPVFASASPDHDLRIAIPMVCFCDMPLSQAAAHMNTYGRYALGLTKSWGMSHGVSPLLYTYAGSATSDAVAFLHLRIEQLQGTMADGAEFSPDAERFLCFVKPYSGEVTVDGEAKSVRFYDEREWRFVPRAGWRALRPDAFADPALRAEAQNALWPQRRLSFEPSDVRYIIVESESEIASIVEQVRQIKTPKYSEQDIRVLCSRIVSAERVLADF